MSNIDGREIKYTPIDDIMSFRKWGDIFTRIGYNEEKDIFLFERTTPEGHPIAWEVVKPRPIRGVRTYPSSAAFGIWGKCVSATEAMRPKMEKLFREGW